MIYLASRPPIYLVVVLNYASVRHLVPLQRSPEIPTVMGCCVSGWMRKAPKRTGGVGRRILELPARSRSQHKGKRYRHVTQWILHL